VQRASGRAKKQARAAVASFAAPTPVLVVVALLVLAAAALWAALGVGIGALVRNQVGALVGLCAWMFLVESISSSFVPGFGRLMPGGAGIALAGNTDKPSIIVAAALLVLYTAAAAAGGWFATLQRDVA